MHLEAALYKYFQYTTFRPQQKQIIQSILDGQDTVALLPTGSGKSICFQLPGLLLPGITLVVTPLIALMQDQVDNLLKRDIPATYISSALSRIEVQQRIQLLKIGKYKLLYISPERLQQKRFSTLCKKLNISLIIIDEAHCISEWGHDFRPEYLQIANFIIKLNHRPAVAAFTATATPKTLDIITNSLKLRSPRIFRSSFVRSNLSLHVCETTSFQLQELLLLLLLQKHSGEAGIIYVSTRASAQYVCELVQKFAVNRAVGYYHGELPSQQRQYIQKLFMAGKLTVVVATSAFGMGVDKSDIKFIIHFHFPGSIEAYYQEIGRAGRGGDRAQCYLLFNKKNEVIHTTLFKKIISDQARAHKEEQLRQMKDYASSKTCRMQKIVEYFNEAKCPNCAECDVCTTQKNDRDPVLKRLLKPSQYNSIMQLHRQRQLLQEQYRLQSYAEVLTDNQLLMMHILKPAQISDFACIPGCGKGWIIQWASHFLQKNDKIRV